jgi:hypothetical protein
VPCCNWYYRGCGFDTICSVAAFVEAKSKVVVAAALQASLQASLPVFVQVLLPVLLRAFVPVFEPVV